MGTQNIHLKNKAELEKMRRAGAAVRQVLNHLSELAKPGVSTADLDEEARILIEKLGASPAFLDYPHSKPGFPPFPAVICSSVNEEIIHGIPNKNPLKEGDILSIDFGCCLDGFYGDSAVTVAIGKTSQVAEKLMSVTKTSLQLALQECVVGGRIGDISHAVQSYVEGHGFGIIRDFVGHGIGANMHEPPQVPNFGTPKQGRILKPGMTLAVEPMVSAGSFHTKILDDGWTAVTKDGSLAAHFEHTVAITEKGPYVLTAD